LVPALVVSATVASVASVATVATAATAGTVESVEVIVEVSGDGHSRLMIRNSAVLAGTSHLVSIRESAGLVALVGEIVEAVTVPSAVIVRSQSALAASAATVVSVETVAVETVAVVASAVVAGSEAIVEAVTAVVASNTGETEMEIVEAGADSAVVAAGSEAIVVVDSEAIVVRRARAVPVVSRSP